MKKFIMIAAMAAVTLSASAQSAFKKSALTDNMSISLQGGVYEPMYGGDFFKDMRPVVRLSLNKYFNTVMGVSLYGEAFINNNNGNINSNTTCQISPLRGFKTAIDFSNVGANALVNLSNLFCGYKGQPRPFEVAAEAGIGWGHMYGHPNGGAKGDDLYSYATTNFALDFNFNVAQNWQINLRPALQYQNPNIASNGQGGFWRLDIRSAVMQVTAGVAYKFGKDFTFCDKLYGQAEMDELNGKINGLRGELDAAKRDAANWKKKYEDELNKPKAAPVTQVVEKVETSTQLAPVVIFDQGKSIINKAQQPSVQMIATYLKNHPDAKVTIKGYASPEGSAELNQKLSEKRADAVKNMLVNTYKINSSRLTAEGLGATSEIFPENDWNRVVIFLEDK